MQQNINIITLGVSDMARSMAFYEEGLGWKRSDASQGEIVFFQMGGIALAFFPREALALDIGIPPVGEGFSGVTLAYNSKSEEEVDQIMQQVEQLGAEIVKPAEKVFWGGYSGYFKDPDGHLFEVAHNPYAKFDDQRNLVL